MITAPVVAAERADAKFVSTHFNTNNSDGIHSNLYFFILGLLMSQYTLTGYDTSAHILKKQTGMAQSLIEGWGYILGLTFATKDIPYLLSPDNDAGGYAIAEAFYLSFKSQYGNGAGGIVCLAIPLPYFCCHILLWYGISDKQVKVILCLLLIRMPVLLSGTRGS
ncbi:hypothetical protein ACP70R_047774 [Stipagrostis hirtigluma subsp. patula]